MWTALGSTELNSKQFRWERGGVTNSNYDVVSNSTLRVTAASGTDRKIVPSDENRQFPMIVFPIQGDFEASVKVEFSSNTSFQRALLGVRDANSRYEQVILYLMENSRIEAGIISAGNSGTLAPPINHSSDVMYLKIRRKLGNVALFFSTNGLQWTPAAPEIQFRLSEKCEIFFAVLSAHNPYTATAEFKDFSLKRL